MLQIVPVSTLFLSICQAQIPTHFQQHKSQQRKSWSITREGM